MPSSAQRGAYYKGRTKLWLERHGWQVADLEVVRWVGGAATGIRFPVKKDQFASDLLAVNADRVLFVQVKSGKTARATLAPALRAFSAFTFPAVGVSCVVAAWLPGARRPELAFTGEPIIIEGGKNGQAREKAQERIRRA